RAANGSRCGSLSASLPADEVPMSRSSHIDRPPAVVIGVDSITGLQTARVLTRHGVPVFGIARHRHHPGCRTNACRALVYAGARDEELIAALHQLARTTD